MHILLAQFSYFWSHEQIRMVFAAQFESDVFNFRCLGPISYMIMKYFSRTLF